MSGRTDARLRTIRDALYVAYGSADIRGEGAAAWLYSQFGGKAIEASVHEGNVWMEFWGPDTDDVVLKEMTVPSAEEAVAAISKWFDSSV